MNGSSGRQRVSAEVISQFKIHHPDNDAMATFKTAIEPVFSMMRQNSQENICLSALRDKLLPRLMSGEIDVSNITL